MFPGAGARGRGTDCHSQCAHWPRNDRGFYMGCGTRPGGSSGRPTPTHRLPIGFRRGRRPRRPASVTRGAVRRADRVVRPYGGVQGMRQGERFAWRRIAKNAKVKSRSLLQSAFWWGMVDSNHRRHRQQIYSLSPLATREIPHIIYEIGAGGRIRTPDLLITNQLLYQLSYTSSSNSKDYLSRT